MSEIMHLASSHPVVTHHVGIVLALFGLAFALATPIWRSITRRRSVDRFNAKFVRPAELRVERRHRGF